MFLNTLALQIQSPREEVFFVVTVIMGTKVEMSPSFQGDPDEDGFGNTEPRPGPRDPFDVRGQVSEVVSELHKEPTMQEDAPYDGIDISEAVVTGAYDRETGNIMIQGLEFLTGGSEPIQALYAQLQGKIMAGEVGVIAEGWRTDAETGELYRAEYVVDGKGGFGIIETKVDKSTQDSAEVIPEQLVTEEQQEGILQEVISDVQQEVQESVPLQPEHPEHKVMPAHFGEAAPVLHRDSNVFEVEPRTVEVEAALSNDQAQGEVVIGVSEVRVPPPLQLVDAVMLDREVSAGIVLIQEPVPLRLDNTPMFPRIKEYVSHLPPQERPMVSLVDKVEVREASHDVSSEEGVVGTLALDVDKIKGVQQENHYGAQSLTKAPEHDLAEVEQGYQEVEIADNERQGYFIVDTNDMVLDAQQIFEIKGEASVSEGLVLQEKVQEEVLGVIEPQEVFVKDEVGQDQTLRKPIEVSGIAEESKKDETQDKANVDGKRGMKEVADIMISKVQEVKVVAQDQDIKSEITLKDIAREQLRQGEDRVVASEAGRGRERNVKAGERNEGVRVERAVTRVRQSPEIVREGGGISMAQVPIDVIAEDTNAGISLVRAQAA